MLETLHHSRPECAIAKVGASCGDSWPKETSLFCIDVDGLGIASAYSGGLGGEKRSFSISRTICPSGAT